MSYAEVRSMKPRYSFAWGSWCHKGCWELVSCLGSFFQAWSLVAHPLEYHFPKLCLRYVWPVFSCIVCLYSWSGWLVYNFSVEWLGSSLTVVSPVPFSRKLVSPRLAGCRCRGRLWMIRHLSDTFFSIKLVTLSRPGADSDFSVWIAVLSSSMVNSLRRVEFCCIVPSCRIFWKYVFDVFPEQFCRIFVGIFADFSES